MSFEFEDHVTPLSPEWLIERFPATFEHPGGRLKYGDYRTRFGSMKWQYDAETKSFALWINGERVGCETATRLQFYRICDAIELEVPNDDRSWSDDL